MVLDLILKKTWNNRRNLNIGLIVYIFCALEKVSNIYIEFGLETSRLEELNHVGGFIDNPGKSLLPCMKWTRFDI